MADTIMVQGIESNGVAPSIITMRMIMQGKEVGSIIGKGTGASIQVASEMLPNSTERAVTVSGTAEAVTACIRVVCNIMLESPPKGATIPYRPKPAVPPLVYAGGQAFVIQNPQMPMLSPGELSKLNQMSIGQPVPMLPPTTYLPVSTPGFAPIQFQQQQIQNGPVPTPTGHQTHEMNIPNDLIGCIIGRGGQKINEIRQLSGANIKISNAEDGCPDRKVTITGTPEMVGMAQYLINTSMDLHKTLVIDPNSAATSPTSTVTPTSTNSVNAMNPPTVTQQGTPVGMPLTIPAMKPLQIMGLNDMNGYTLLPSAFHGFNGFNGFNYGLIDPLLMAGGIMQPTQQQATGFTGKVRVGMAAVKMGSPKFSPY